MNKTLIIICAIAVILPSIIKKILASYINRRAFAYLNARDFNSFYKILSSFFAKFSLYPFNLEYFKLNGAFIQENKKMIDSQIELIDSKIKMNTSQKTEFYYKSFMYYVSQENKNKSNYFLKQITTLENEEIINNANIVYDIYINKGDRYLDTLLNEIKEKDIKKEELISKQTLIMQIYENIGDKKSANKYKKLIKEFYNN